MIDCHAHLQDAAFEHDLDDVVREAKLRGVRGCVVVGEHPREAAKIQDIVGKFAGWALAGLGLYPKYFSDSDIAEFDHALKKHGPWHCIGEVGLDRWIVQDEEERERQEFAFKHVIAAAIREDLVLNVHSRSACRRAIEVLSEMGAKRVQMHAADAKASTINLGIEAGYYFSIPLSILDSPQKQKLARLVPLQQLLLETDSPVLAPDRSSRNTPANLPLALKALADIRGIAASELEQILDDNARRLYRSFAF
ncbi:MAG: TatD family hydrolase [Bradymonadales bacterium]|jgi:TatD DNase family protein